jgi:hypothetical protein
MFGCAAATAASGSLRRPVINAPRAIAAKAKAAAHPIPELPSVTMKNWVSHLLTL